MSTWQIFSSAGNSFRWDVSDLDIESQKQGEPAGNGPASSHIQRDDSSSRLPSMADLLLQGCSKLMENRDEAVEKFPMFKTGLGRSVPVKQSSIAKALSVLGNDAAMDIDQIQAKDNERGFSNSFFQTGHVQDRDDECAFSNSLFQTGHVQARDNECGFPNSLFQTGSGKIVNISTDGLARAKTLLGLEECNGPSNVQCFQGTRNLPNTDKRYEWQNFSHLEMREGVNHNGKMDTVASVSRSSVISTTEWGQSRIENEAKPHVMQSTMQNSAHKPPPIKFHTAGGRSISVSNDALQRARSLLGDPELGTFFSDKDADDSVFAFSDSRSFDDILLNKEIDTCSRLSYQEMAKSKHMSKSFVSPLRLSANQIQLSLKSGTVNPGTNLMKQFDAVGQENFCPLNGNATCPQRPLSNGSPAPCTVVDNSLENGTALRKNAVGMPRGRHLVDISNTIGTTSTGIKQPTNGKKRIGGTSVSPFKRPRSSKFSTPVNKHITFLPNGLSTLPPENSCCKGRVSTRYPFRVKRKYVKEYFGIPPSEQNTLACFSDQVRWIRSDNADKYTFPDDSGLSCIGAEAMFHMLAQAGASSQVASKKWVTNHYKWIIWKLACYERCYPTKSAGNFLTVSNVLEELKYRYEREVNHGHRSAIKRILEGDASPSTMFVVCISAIRSNCESEIEASTVVLDEAENHSAAKVELTDGWYSVDALLDVLLSKQLASGKLFVGQKLRIWGAGLCGWDGPISPLEVPRTVNLLLHINGTYRAHWADRLGFCKGVGAPLAFKGIKANGGPVPRTLVGITRIYPVLYKERLSNGRSIVRSERIEAKVVQSYNQRRSIIIEGIVSEFQRGIKHSHSHNDSDSEEGAKILKVLETASEPEVLMAEMSPEQLSSFATYRAKIEAIKQSDMEKYIEKALTDAGLSRREVNPFMRVRVVGLTSKMYQGKDSPKEGLITIWNPTEKQQTELIEGKAYDISGLLPINTDADTIYLQARGSTAWCPFSPQAIEHFKPFFKPRKSVLLSNMGEVPLSSEFDIAAYVVYVGEVYRAAHLKKQWVFVTDGSIAELQSEEFSNSLLAICFCSPYIDDDSFTPINYNLVGSTVGFCNIIKRAKDQVNHLWVAEASENSTYFLSFNTPHFSHLKDAAAAAERWGKISAIPDKLREKVLFIIGDCKGFICLMFRPPPDLYFDNEHSSSFEK
ncbi:hypothetical protein FNV43_RR08748 [Rhamnella rubrinervis]|uniref:Tower domain-containing protein n=1 Tax=Rhamnella rubrinervis TaxID=2594499 RepID=A0A8K0MJN2_9ROSA|nr:hypothetical protein FNV43_RR08748 [Rhamnella rubrinervis]